MFFCKLFRKLASVQCDSRHASSNNATCVRVCNVDVCERTNET
jgi:hypothetical protein